MPSDDFRLPIFAGPEKGVEVADYTAQAPKRTSKPWEKDAAWDRAWKDFVSKKAAETVKKVESTLKKAGEQYGGFSMANIPDGDTWPATPPAYGRAGFGYGIKLTAVVENNCCNYKGSVYYFYPFWAVFKKDLEGTEYRLDPSENTVLFTTQDTSQHESYHTDGLPNRRDLQQRAARAGRVIQGAIGYRAAARAAFVEAQKEFGQIVTGTWPGIKGEKATVANCVGKIGTLTIFDGPQRRLPVWLRPVGQRGLARPAGKNHPSRRAAGILQL